MREIAFSDIHYNSPRAKFAYRHLADLVRKHGFSVMPVGDWLDVSQPSHKTHEKNLRT